MLRSRAINGERQPARHDVGCVSWPVLPWGGLASDRYRRALRSGDLRCGVYTERPFQPELPTILVIHGAEAAPAQFSPFAARFRDRANCAALVWDCRARLAPTTEVLRRALLRIPGSVTIVAHSMGMLLPAYLGATDRVGALRQLAAVYLNPLIGGSRYAGDFRALAWLGVGRLLQRAFCRPSFLDLAPESDLQQTICGSRGSRSSFAEHTTILFTERQGQEPDIPPGRVPYYFGRTRQQVLARLGTTVHLPPRQARAHQDPVRIPEIVFPLLDQALSPSGLAAAPRASYGM